MFWLQGIGDFDNKMRRSAVITTIAALGLVACGKECAAECRSHLSTVVLVSVIALVALRLLTVTSKVTIEASVCLCANTDNVANLDVTFGLRSNSDGDTYDLVADDDRVRGLALQERRSYQ